MGGHWPGQHGWEGVTSEGLICSISNNILCHKTTQELLMFVRLTPCNLFAIFQISFFGLLFCQKTKTFVLEWFNSTCGTSQTQVVTVRHVR